MYMMRSFPSADPLFCNRRAHEAGVCTISPHPHVSHLLATGSYDEGVRLWDVRSPAKPLQITKVRSPIERMKTLLTSTCLRPERESLGHAIGV